MRRVLILSAGLLLFSWSAAIGCGTPGAIASPAPTPQPSPQRDDLTGTWVFGTPPEPVPGPVIRCYPYDALQLTQDGERLIGLREECPAPCFLAEQLTGTNQNGRVHLTGTRQVPGGDAAEPVTYELTFNPASQHLVGTRNGQPFWAALLDTTRPCDSGIR